MVHDLKKEFRRLKERMDRIQGLLEPSDVVENGKLKRLPKTRKLADVIRKKTLDGQQTISYRAFIQEIAELDHEPLDVIETRFMRMIEKTKAVKRHGDRVSYDPKLRKSRLGKKHIRPEK